MMMLSTRAEEVRIEGAIQAHGAEKEILEGEMWLPEDHVGVVVFASADGARRLRPSNDYVASMMRHARLATLKVNLMQPGERRHGHQFQHQQLQENQHLEGMVQGIPLMAERLHTVCDWLRSHPATEDSPIGLFAAGECAPAMLQFATQFPKGIAAMVSKGGRLDLLHHGVASKLNVPTMLIVGSLDQRVMRQHHSAHAQLRCKKRLEIIPGATHAFEEPGNQEVVARLARGWFLQHATTSALSL
jgi:putative phosphoribosyl transferase